MSLSVCPAPDGLYEQLRDQCVALGIEVDVNARGNPVSVHWCTTCGQRYTVCPPSPMRVRRHLSSACASYDPDCDVEMYFAPDDPALIR